ncbi:MAG: sensory histidine kinase CreC [Methanocella sp. PtaU1.Bin125]|nr:MAG: sensory histidine kinase CreC [Methanocella sp. PtaU1.Bin125]
MRFTSLKVQTIILLLFVIVTPILIVGILSSVYYRDVIKNNIWDYNMAQARTTATLTEHYFDSAARYLEGQSTRLTVIDAVVSRDTGFLNETLFYIQNNSDYYAVYIVDGNGVVIASYPYYELVNRDISSWPQVREVLRTGIPYSGDATISPVTGRPTVYISSPIRQNNSTVGAMIGAIDLLRFQAEVIGTPVVSGQYVYLVNRTGHVMVHNNRTYMDHMTDFSWHAAVWNVTAGRQGLIEHYNPMEDKQKLAAYTPVPRYGWGVIVSLPVDIAYMPIANATRWISSLIVALMILSLLIAGVAGSYIADPIHRMTRATRAMPYGNYRKDLPLVRRDEIGDLARAFDHMAGVIRADQQQITEARDRAEEEKKRAELYVDIMGHDINNLNQVGLTSLEFLDDEPGISDEGRKMLEMAINSVRGSAEIIENVHKIQTITSDGFDLEPVDINDMLLRCMQEAPRPAGKEVHFNYAGRPGMRVRAVPLLKELFSNLVSNSIKYSGPEVTIDIGTGETVEDGKKYYVITVADNGHGIPDDVKPRLFRRFERGTTKAHGKGLGLYIVRMLAERFGGSVSVEDRVPGDYGKGAKFIVRLPAARD